MQNKIGQLTNFLLDKHDAMLVSTEHNRRYLTGFAATDGWLLVTADGAYFLTDFRYIEAARQQVKGAQCLMIYRLSDTLQELFDKHKIHRVFVEADGMSLAEISRLQQRHPKIEWFCGPELDLWLRRLRVVKTPEERRKIQQAQELTEYGFTHILPTIAPGRTEREIALELEFLVRKQGAESVAFDFIVVSGTNSSLPHGVPGNKVLDVGDFVTMDFGAVVDGWHSDMTRTVAIGQVTEEQRNIYQLVRQAQETALAGLHAGMKCTEGDALARDVIAAAGYGDNFGHGTGHGVGIQIHEEPRLSTGAGDDVLTVGNVVTVEPGIYLPGKFGVRIEDMVYITEDGCEDLTHATKELLIL